MKLKQYRSKEKQQLSRILGMHETGNNGYYNGEAILSESVADEIRAILGLPLGKNRFRDGR